jgi:predicted ATPase/DNA-binding XRE family transcriptional regulator
MTSDPSGHALSIGDLLRQHRRARELTQEALAERASVSVRAISDLERGTRTHPYRETAILLAGALGLIGSEREIFLAAARRPVRTEARVASPGLETRLPVALTRLIGRGEEVGEIRGLLRDERVRLLTLTGPAGGGKTRLAVAAAAGLCDAFPDGIVFVDLAPLRNPAQVAPAIAAAFGPHDQGSIPPLEALRRTLSTRRVLLVLDNFEHLLEAAPILSEIVQSGPAVQILVTSRAVLRLHGEREYPVRPLPTPAPEAPAPLADLADWEAIQLFVERAGEAQPRFRLAEENAPDVVAICHRLDGLPLAIELAAARIKILSPATLLARLEKRLPLLTGGRRDAPERQRTLHAAIAWSYDLLDPAEQTLLRGLAVFTGGWTLEAAEAVGARGGVPDVLAALAALVEQSLVARDDTALAPRYRMLETVREFAGAQRLAAGEEESVRRAHLDFLLQLARENDLERLDAEVGTRLARLKADEANLLNGIEWAIEHDPECALALLAELDWFWFLADRPGVGRVLHERVLAVEAGMDRHARSRVLQQTAWLASAVGDFAALGPLADAARAFAEPLGDTRTLAYALMHQGDIAMSQGDIIRAEPLLEDALTQFESLNDIWGMMVCLTVLGIAAQDRGDPAGAAAHFERVGAIVTARRLPAHHQAHHLANLASAYRLLGRYEEAFDASAEALELAQESGRISVAAVAQGDLSRLLLDRGDIARAAPLAAESLAVLWEIGNSWDVTLALELAAAVMAAGGRAEPAARLFAAAAGLRESMPYPIGAGERDALERQLAEVSSALGEPAFTRAWTAGQVQPLDATVAEARAVLAMLAS